MHSFKKTNKKNWGSRGYDVFQARLPRKLYLLSRQISLLGCGEALDDELGRLTWTIHLKKGGGGARVVDQLELTGPSPDVVHRFLRRVALKVLDSLVVLRR